MPTVEEIQQSYSEEVSEIEQQFSASYAAADGEYSRVTQYAGLVRQELVNIAVRRREAALEGASARHAQMVDALAGVTREETEDATEQTAAGGE